MLIRMTDKCSLHFNKYFYTLFLNIVSRPESWSYKYIYLYDLIFNMHYSYNLILFDLLLFIYYY